MQIIHASKADKKNIKGFYKAQGYSASYLGYDQVYFVIAGQQVIASAIVSQINPDNCHWLLHALVVDQKFQHQGVATKLLQHIKKHHLLFSCFATSSLAPLYLQNGLSAQSESLLTQLLPNDLYLRLISYRKKQPALKVYHFNNDS